MFRCCKSIGGRVSFTCSASSRSRPKFETGRPASGWRGVIGRPRQARCCGRRAQCTQSYRAVRTGNRARQCGERMRRCGEKCWSCGLSASPRSDGTCTGARRRASCLCCGVQRRRGCGDPGLCDAERVSPPANSRSCYFSLSVRWVTK
jgi:hypothetical protein